MTIIASVFVVLTVCWTPVWVPCLYQFFLRKLFLFIWLHWVFVAACGFFSCRVWDLFLWPGIKPVLPASADGFLSTGSPRKPRILIFKKNQCFEMTEFILNSHPHLKMGLPWWLRCWRILLQCKRPGFDPWVGKIPWRRNGNSLQYFCLENSMDRGMVGYGPWSHKRVRHDWETITFHLKIVPDGNGALEFFQFVY